MVKLIELSEDDEDHRSVNKTIELVRDNQHSRRKECSDGQLGNRRNNRYGQKKSNLRSRAHTNHVDFQAVNAIEAESSSHVKAGDWNCISNLHLQFSITILMF